MEAPDPERTLETLRGFICSNACAFVYVLWGDNLIAQPHFFFERRMQVAVLETFLTAGIGG